MGKTDLIKGNKDERLAWNEYANAPVKLAAMMAAIRSTIES